MNNLFNGAYDVLLFNNDLNKIVTYNFVRFDNALYVLLYWFDVCENTNDWYKSIIPIMIKKNGRCIARTANYKDYYKYVFVREV